MSHAPTKEKNRSKKAKCRSYGRKAKTQLMLTYFMAHKFIQKDCVGMDKERLHGDGRCRELIGLGFVICSKTCVNRWLAIRIRWGIV
jgi:hypothetical protein